MPSLVDRYLIRCILPPALLALVIIVALVLLLQLLRLGHHFAAALDDRALAEVLAYGLPTLVAFALPLSLVAGVLFGLGRLSDSSQLVALRALGLSRLRLAAPVVAVAVVFAAVAFGAARLEPGALRHLHALLVGRAAQSAIGAVRPGLFHDIGPDVTLFARARRASPEGEARFGGLLLARGGAREILVAKEATVRFRGDARLALELHDAELQMRNSRGGLRRVRMRRYTEDLDLGPAIRPHFGFLLRRAAEGRQRVASPCACLALGLMAAALGLLGTNRLAMAGLGAVAAGAFMGLGGLADRIGAGPWGHVALTALAVLLTASILSRRWRSAPTGR